MSRFIVPLELLKAAERFVSKEETRYYLNGVNVEFIDGRFRFTATNGHIMLIATPKQLFHDGQAFENFILPAHTIKTLKAGKTTRNATWALIDTEAKSVSACAYAHVIELESFDALKQQGMSLNYTPIDGTFPDYMRVIPGPDNYETPAQGACFNPSYLAVFDFARSIDIQINENLTGPAIITGSTKEFHFFGVVMTMRGDAERSSRPEWLFPEKKEIA